MRQYVELDYYEVQRIIAEKFGVKDNAVSFYYVGKDFGIDVVKARIDTTACDDTERSCNSTN